MEGARGKNKSGNAKKELFIKKRTLRYRKW